MRHRRYFRSVRGQVCDHLRDSFDAAFDGDPLAAGYLMTQVPRRLRGHLAFLAYQCRTPDAAYRRIIAAAWAIENRRLLSDFWSPTTIRRLIVRAAFPAPALDYPVAVYRPAVRCAVREASPGMCWSLSAGVVHSERWGGGSRRSPPRLIHALARREDVIWWSDLEGEQEVCFRSPLGGAETDRELSLNEGWEPVRIAASAGRRS